MKVGGKNMTFEKNNDFLSAALKEAVSESLENMLFSVVYPVDFYWGSVEVLEPLKGKVTVAFPRSLAIELVHTIYGFEKGMITTDIIFDIIAEIANTVAGRLMNVLVPHSDTFELSVPKTGAGPLEPANGVSCINHYLINDEVYVVRLEGEELFSVSQNYNGSQKLSSSIEVFTQSDEDDGEWG